MDIVRHRSPQPVGFGGLLGRLIASTLPEEEPMWSTACSDMSGSGGKPFI
jgi:hypothetical protein